MEEYEFFVLPVNQVLPFDVTKYYPTEINGVKMENYLSWMKSAWYITATGNPAASVPCDEVPTWTKLWPLPVLWKRSGRRENHPSRFRSRTFSVITLLSGDFVRIVLAGESEISALAVAMRASKIPQTPPVGPTCVSLLRLVRIGLPGLSSTFFRMAFLDQYERRPFTLADTGSLKPAGLYLGKGPSPVEVVTFESSTRPTVTALRAAWKARLAGRATPLLVVTLYDSKAALCCPSGDQPPAYVGIELGRAQRVGSTALEEPDRHAALRFLPAQGRLEIASRCSATIFEEVPF